ncbi:hypothetical protein COCNU_10G006210 [Cocos nucifera]|uniref:Uncharacterized protein n=1 Tax=Cocos nucifera TaxID=13894 RepID=A0A8K0IMH5_COCNU|nr:hypothetical protein COCNU_10G006210 [Cocos nucifera]
MIAEEFDRLESVRRGSAAWARLESVRKENPGGVRVAERASGRSPAAWSPRSSAVRKFGWRWEFGPEPGAGEFGS